MGCRDALAGVETLAFEPASEWIEYHVRRKADCAVLPIFNHGRGFYTIYGHLSSVSVQANARVLPGQVIGAVGETGSLKGPILHFEIREKGLPRDPLEWLR